MIPSAISKFSQAAGLFCLLLTVSAGASLASVRFDVVGSPTEVINTGRSEVTGSVTLFVRGSGNVTGTAAGGAAQLRFRYAEPAMQIDNTTASGIRLFFSSGFMIAFTPTPASGAVGIVSVENTDAGGQCGGSITINMAPGATPSEGDFIRLEGVRGRIDSSLGVTPGTDLFVGMEAVNDPSAVSFAPDRIRCSRSFDGMQVSIKSACLPNPGQSCGSPIYSITIQEAYARAFVDADANNDGNLTNDRVDSGGNLLTPTFEVNPSGGAPVASTQGALGAPTNSTRFLIRLESIPSSVSGISWPALVPSTEIPLNSALSYVASTFSGSAGVATATYEYQTVNQTDVSDVAIETFSLSPGIFLKSGETGTGTIMAGVSLGPEATEAPGCDAPGGSKARPRFRRMFESDALASNNPPGDPFAALASINHCPSGFMLAGSMAIPRVGHTATLLADGKVLITGGGSTIAELYDRVCDRFYLGDTMSTDRTFHTATLLSNGKVLIAGGGTASVELFNPTTGEFSPTGSMSTARSSHTATLLASGKVLILGGYDSSGVTLRSGEIYDPHTGTFSASASMATSRAQHAATPLPNGNVFISGGTTGNGNSGVSYLTSTELYDPTTGSFTLAGDMSTGRTSHTATLLSDGMVLLSGGFGFTGEGFGSLKTAEVYDPGSSNFTPVGSLGTARSFHTATLLRSGKVLITGGKTGRLGPTLDTAELFNPAKGSFSSRGRMRMPRLLHTATTLENGEILITAGNDESASRLASAEIYRPETADLSLTNTGSPGRVTVGNNLTYTIVVHNNGPDSAEGVVVTDALPAVVKLVSVSSSQGSCAGTGAIKCNMGDIPANSRVTITIVVNAEQGGLLSNTGSVTSSTHDPQPANNSSQATTSVVAPRADLTLTGAGDPESLTVGNVVTYTLRASNKGPDPAEGVFIAGKLPEGVKLISATSNKGACSGSSTPQCRFETLAPGETATVKIVAGVKHSGVINYTAAVISFTDDPNLSNNEASLKTTVRNLSLAFPLLAATITNPSSLLTGGARAGAASQRTAIAITNLSDATARLTFTALDKAGNLISGTNILNPRSVDLTSGGQLAFLDFQVFGTGFLDKEFVGWVNLESNVSQVAAFFLTFDDNLSVLDGADVSRQTLSSLVLTEIEDEGFTQIQISNPSSEPARVILELVTSNGSLRTNPVVRMLKPKSAVAESFNTLFPGITPAASNYIRISSDAGVAGVQYLGKPGRFAEVLNGQDAGGGNTVLYCPQYVVGGPSWRSTISIVNLDSFSGTVTLRLISDDGTQLGDTRQLPISPRGKIYIEEQDFFLQPGSVPVQGYVEIRSSGPKLAGSVVFGDQGRERFASALPLVSSLPNDAIYSHVASDATYFMGLVMANPSDTEARADIKVFKKNGELLISKTEVIPAKSRRSGLLTEYFPELLGREISSGYVRVAADKGIATFAVFGTHDLSVLSAVPPQTVP